MDTPFEKFMKESRESFNTYEPPTNTWQGIEKNLEQHAKPRINWRLIVARAAAVVVIFMASYYFHAWKSGSTQLFSGHDNAVEIPEITEMENYYQRVIHDKMQEIQPMLAHYPGLDTEINRDMQDLDSVYADLKSDLQDNIANRAVIEAMVQNYRLRVEILVELLTMLSHDQQPETLKSESHEL